MRATTTPKRGAIALEIGAPLEEARALEGLGHGNIQDGNHYEGRTYLRQALTIYQRIGATDALRVQEALRHHELIPITAEPARPMPRSC